MRRGLKRTLLAAAALVAAVVAFDAYSRADAEFDLPAPEIDPATRTLVLLVHGSGGREEPTLMALERRARELLADRDGVTVLRYIWSPYSDARFRASANGQRAGTLLGAALARLPALAGVHVIVHSAGAYLPEAMCAELRRAAGRPVRVDMTFLDPIGFRGVLDTGWGVRNYGACADYAEAIINTDDPVPATNSPLQQAWNVDVTAAGKASGFTGGGHRWPVQYYLENVTAAELLPGAHSHAERPRGGVVQAGHALPDQG